MSSQHPRTTVFGFVVMTALLIGAILVASVPIMAGAALAAFLPEYGELREGVGWKHALHVLWMYPALFFLSSVVGGVERYVRFAFDRTPPWLSPVLQFIGLWIPTTLMCLVFFEHTVGAAIAAAVAILGFPLLVWFLERTPADSDDDRAPSST